MLYFRLSFIDFTKTKVIIYFLKQAKKVLFAYKISFYIISNISIYILYLWLLLYIFFVLYFLIQSMSYSLFLTFLYFSTKKTDTLIS